MSDDAPTVEEAERRTRRWIEEAVIDLEFCPFAASFYHGDRVRIAFSEAEEPLEAVDAAIEEVDHLLDSQPADVATTLIVYSRALARFRTFLDVAETVRGALDEVGATGILQVATFHPDYQFAGTEREDLQNYTNRSPYPTLHLLREEDVTRAVEDHPDPEAIPENNIARLEEMGREEVERIWEEFADLDG
jgi:hypothetical protein